MAEKSDLKSEQCGFESHRSYFAEVVEWQTRQTQNLVPKKRVGSSPTFGIENWR